MRCRNAAHRRVPMPRARRWPGCRPGPGGPGDRCRQRAAPSVDDAAHGVDPLLDGDLLDEDGLAAEAVDRLTYSIIPIGVDPDDLAALDQDVLPLVAEQLLQVVLVREKLFHEFEVWIRREHRRVERA